MPAVHRMTTRYKESHMSEKEQTTETRQEDSGVLSEEARVLEALLFASDEVLTPAALKGLIPGGPDARAVRKLAAEVNMHLQKQRHPFEIVELGGGYQFRTIAYYRPWVGKLLKEKTTRKLSLQALECLAIIAYKQPITKAEIEAIRGVISDGAMKTLLERRMATIVGRSDKPGRPLLYGTSKEFLEYFGINKLSDLPRIEEFEAMAREKMDQLSEEEQAMLEAAPDDTEELEQESGEAASDNAPQPGGEDPGEFAEERQADAENAEESTSAEREASEDEPALREGDTGAQRGNESQGGSKDSA
ncbi:MAG: SMC-Scp complex subunit ScpB [Chitinivibrionales bacterium]|nr:SMC-Scp complex subunit ScpB [Chitinivibrionales bacterium]MBD3394677.1 SMC-Scp complex subunit ScpB [Chitinivibrionales bacterium]